MVNQTPRAKSTGPCPRRTELSLNSTYPRRGLGHHPFGDSRYPARFARAVAASCSRRRFASRTIQDAISENPSGRCPNPRRCVFGTVAALRAKSIRPACFLPFHKHFFRDRNRPTMEAQRTGRRGARGRKHAMGRKDCWAIGRFGSGLTPPPKWEDVFTLPLIGRCDGAEWTVGCPGLFGGLPGGRQRSAPPE